MIKRFVFFLVIAFTWGQRDVSIESDIKNYVKLSPIEKDKTYSLGRFNREEYQAYGDSIRDIKTKIDIYNFLAFSYIFKKKERSEFFLRKVDSLLDLKDYPYGRYRFNQNYALYYKNKGQFERANTFYKESLKNSEAMHYLKGSAKNLRFLGDSYAAANQYISALLYYDKSLLKEVERNDLHGQILSLRKEGNVYIKINYFEKAREFYTEALDLAKSISNEYQIDLIQLELGDVFLKEKLPEKALEIYRSISDKKESAILLKSTSLFKQAIVLKSQEKYSDALELFFEAKDGFKKIAYGKSQIFLEMADCFHEIGATRKEEEQIRIALRSAKKQGKDNVLCQAYLKLGQFFAAHTKMDSSRIYFEKAFKLASELNALFLLKETSYCMSKYYEELLEYESAYLFLEKHKKFTDQFNASEQMKKLSRLQLQTDFQKEVVKERFNNQRTQLILAFLIIIIIFLLAALIFIVKYFKNKTRSKRLSLVEDITQLGYWDYHIAQKKLYVSSQTRALFALEKEDEINLEILSDFFIGNDKHNFQRIIEERIEKGGSCSADLQVSVRYNKKRWLRMYMEYGENKKSDAKLIAVFQDISEEKKQREYLRKADERYRKFISNSTEAIWRMECIEELNVSDPKEKQIELMYWKMKIVECNDKFAQLYGYKKAEDVIGRMFSELTDFTDELQREMGAFIEASYKTEERLTREVIGTGEERYFISNILADIEAGVIQNLWGIQRDVTQEKQNEAALEKSEALFRNIFENSPIGLIMIDFKGRAIQANKSSFDFFEVDYNDIAQMTSKKLSHPEDYEETRRLSQECLDGKRDSFRQEKRYIVSSKKEKWALLNSTLFYNMDGKAEFFISQIVDISDRKTAEEERKKLLKTIQAKNDELQSIVYVTSHDLRSPLVNIQGFSKEIEAGLKELKKIIGKISNSNLRTQIETIFRDDIEASLSFIRAGSSKMDQLLKGLLKLSRLGRIELELMELDMNDLLQSITEAMKYQLDEAEVSLEIKELASCKGSNEELNQLFTNLIDNALKYRDLRRKLKIEIWSELKRKYRVYHVKDNGLGIAKEHQKKIFEIFHRLNPNSGIDGEGLGLAIIRRIIDRHFGKIEVKSKLGEGSEFIVYLPKNGA